MAHSTADAGKLILFDLDGTLVDSAPDIASCVDGVLLELGLPGLGIDRIRSFIGHGAEQLVHRALTNDIDGRADTETFDAAYASFSRRYARDICTLSRLYPGVADTLAALRGRGWHLGCVTNKPGRFTEPLLESLGVDKFFSVVLSGDTLDTKKPDPGPLLHAARVCGIAVERCIVVGDSPTDVRAARAAGMPVICVTYGYALVDQLLASEPDAVVDAMPAILDLLGDDAVFAGAPLGRPGRTSIRGQ